MKITTLLLSLLLLSQSLSHAAIFVYQNKLKATLTGGGSIIKRAVGGYTITDTDTGAVVQLVSVPAAHTFIVHSATNVWIQNVSAAGKTYLTLLQSSGYTDDQQHNHVETGSLKGQYVPVTVNGTGWVIPKTFTWIGHAVYPVGGNTIFEETTGNFILDLAASGTSQSAGDTLEAATTRLTNLLLSQGYSQQPSP